MEQTTHRAVILAAHRQALLPPGLESLAIITEHAEHWYWAKSFVRSVLGHPQEATNDRLVYPTGLTIHFYTRKDPRVDMLYPDPIQGYRGKWIFFGRSECDAFVGADRTGRS